MDIPNAIPVQPGADPPRRVRVRLVPRGTEVSTLELHQHFVDTLAHTVGAEAIRLQGHWLVNGLSEADERAIQQRIETAASSPQREAVLQLLRRHRQVLDEHLASLVSCRGTTSRLRDWIRRLTEERLQQA